MALMRGNVGENRCGRAHAQRLWLGTVMSIEGVFVPCHRVLSSGSNSFARSAVNLPLERANSG
ncbi:MAG: hypothetical protein NFCOHLIN_01498 [Gammaproteobacteria bacterium]|nr:hypothetical protein [Gammaproteobacteria bacterium]